MRRRTFLAMLGLAPAAPAAIAVASEPKPLIGASGGPKRIVIPVSSESWVVPTDFASREIIVTYTATSGR